MQLTYVQWGLIGNADAGENFFDDLSVAEIRAPEALSRASTMASPRPHTAHGEDHVGEAGESENEIQRALFVSNHSAAVDICLQVRYVSLVPMNTLSVSLVPPIALSY